MSEERATYRTRPPRSERPDLYECEACNEKPGSPRLCSRCIAAKNAAGQDWIGYWGPKLPSLIPSPFDSEATVLRKVGLLNEHFNVRLHELARAVGTANNPFVETALAAMYSWLAGVFKHHTQEGWMSLPTSIEALEAAQDNATDPAVRDMLGILVDELQSLCVDDGA